jgi:uncharacterized Fe-S cluster-containing radical SAM superfamily protein
VKYSRIPKPRHLDVKQLCALLPGLTAVPLVQEVAEGYSASFQLKLGNLCNLSCLYCNVVRHDLVYLDTPTACELLAEASDNGFARVALIGGEPTIRKDLVQLVETARGLAYTDIMLLTNGLTLADRSTLARLVRAGVTRVQLSLDAFDETILQDLCRHEQAGSLALRAFENLLEEPAVQLDLVAVVVRQNVAHLSEYVQRLAAVADRPNPPRLALASAMQAPRSARAPEATLRVPVLQLAHFTDNGIAVDDDATRAQTDAGTLFLKHSIFWDNANDTASLPTSTGVDGFDATAYFLGAALSNHVIDPMLTDALDLASPSFVPMAGSPALTGGGTPPDDGFFDPSATFVGAFGAEDWTAGWTAFPAN